MLCVKVYSENSTFSFGNGKFAIEGPFILNYKNPRRVDGADIIVKK